MICLDNVYEDYLAHHGIKGQKWGVRRYQNEDGTLTSSGRQRYGESSNGGNKKKKELTDAENRLGEKE